MKPLTAMNESGLAVQRVMGRYNFTDPKKLIVVADDLNTLPGTLMIQGEDHHFVKFRRDPIWGESNEKFSDHKNSYRWW